MPDSTPLLLLYDGDCKACRALMRWTMRRIPEGRLLAQPNRTPGLAENLGLTAADIDREMWVLDGEALLGGAAAANRLGQEMALPFRLLAHLYGLPPIRSLEDRVYRWIAPRRCSLLGRFVRESES